MAKPTLAEIKEKISELERQAEALRAEEVAGVIARIREAIAHYDLTVKDLFGARAAKAGRHSGTRVARNSTKKVGVIRFRDAAGNAWTGRGKRPNWFKAALNNGAKPEDLAAKQGLHRHAPRAT